MVGVGSGAERRLLMCYTTIQCRRQKEPRRECNTASDSSRRNTAAAWSAVKLRGCAVPTIACRGRACPRAYHKLSGTIVSGTIVLCAVSWSPGTTGLDLKPFYEHQRLQR